MSTELEPFCGLGAVSQKSFDFVSQLSHFGWGLALPSLTRALFQASPAYLWVAGTWVVYAALKEGLYDAVDEIPNERGSSLKDFLFQAFGAAVAVGAIWICK